MKAFLKTFAFGVGIVLACGGCGSGFSVVSLVSPTISGVSPQVVTAGTPSVTLTVKGANFDAQSAVTFNGTTVPTTLVSSDTLAAQVGGSALAQPTVVPLQVRNSTGVESNAVDVTVTSEGTDPPAVLTITTTALPSAQVGAAYSATLAAGGGTPGYTWSMNAGSLPAGLTLSSAGVISGTPTASGTSNFTVAVTDSESPAQTKTASFSITTSPTTTTAPLTINTTTLGAGQVGVAYSLTLSASGGTPGYTWSISSGSLPAGLTLSNAGVISGTPTASGSSNFTVAVTDSSSPAQTQTAAISLTIGAPQLTITTTTLSAGQEGSGYSAALSAAGGTQAYSWSVASGTLPAGLTLSGAGIISGTPTSAGSSSFTVKVMDDSSPTQTATWATSITVASEPPPSPGTTWYVRPDGGTRYSSNVPTGLCDGKGDATPAGTTPNQHCAFSDVRYLYMDGTYANGTEFPAWGWVIAGGDTVIIRGSIGTGVSYRIGISNGQTNDWMGGIWGNPYGSGMPPPPSGTAAQHTRILGENYSACATQTAKTQLHGGYGTFDVLDLSGSSYVDVACLDITDYSDCVRSSSGTHQCVTGGAGMDDYANNGIRLRNTSTYDTFTDINAHGLTNFGLYGPTGTGVVMNNISLTGNASGGWNADLSDGTTGVGTLLVQNFNISWNGCAEEYPIVDPLPYNDCTDDSSGGYGDGFGTATVASPAPGWQVHFDQGIVSYNTQDGLDALHIKGPGSAMTVTRTLAYGNQGQQIKVGGSTATIINNIIVGNCEAMTTQAIPGAPAGFGSKLRDPCRAGNTAIVIETTPGDPATYQFNTLYSRGSVGLEVEYATSDQGSGNTLHYNNNIFVGFKNPGNHENPSAIYSNTDLQMFINPGASWTNNVTWGGKSACPRTGESGAICTDPGLTDETYHSYGYGNMAPVSSGNAVQGAGIAIPGLTTDYTGQTRANPPSIGAYE